MHSRNHNKHASHSIYTRTTSQCVQNGSPARVPYIISSRNSRGATRRARARERRQFSASTHPDSRSSADPHTHAQQIIKFNVTTFNLIAGLRAGLVGRFLGASRARARRGSAHQVDAPDMHAARLDNRYLYAGALLFCCNHSTVAEYVKHLQCNDPTVHR